MNFHAVPAVTAIWNEQKSVGQGQSCCFANLTYCIFAVLVAVAVVFAKAPYSPVPNCIYRPLKAMRAVVVNAVSRCFCCTSLRFILWTHMTRTFIFVTLRSRLMCDGLANVQHICVASCKRTWGPYEATTATGTKDVQWAIQELCTYITRGQCKFLSLPGTTTTGEREQQRN